MLKKPIKKKIGGQRVVTPTKRFLSIRSRHPSASDLRMAVLLPKKAVYRHGSVSDHPSPYEINSIQSVKNSSSKLLMKQCFDKGAVKHLPWMLLNETKVKNNELTNGKISIKFPVVIKNFYGSRGQGNYKINDETEFKACLKGKTLNQYLVEPFYSGTVEYRVHITKQDPIYSLRKMLKTDVPKDKRWFRNDSNCVWITEYKQRRGPNNQFIEFSNELSEQFDRPDNWNEIITECKKALLSVGGDILAVDIKTQSNYDSKKNRRAKVDFYILEVNSAPSFGDITTLIYKKELPKILKNKYDNF